jgi:hypothetical protein
VPVTTSSKEQRLSDYLRAMTFKLTPAEVKMVSLSLFLSFVPSFRSIYGWFVLVSDIDFVSLQINEAGSEKHFRAFWTHKFAEDDRR